MWWRLRAGQKPGVQSRKLCPTRAEQERGEVGGEVGWLGGGEGVWRGKWGLEAGEMAFAFCLPGVAGGVLWHWYNKYRIVASRHAPESAWS